MKPILRLMALPSPQMSLLSCDENWLGAFLHRVQNMAYRTKNHPSVCWSLGNEFDSPNHAASLAWLRKLHPLDQSSMREAKGMEILGSSGTGHRPSSDVCPMYHVCSPLQKLLQM